jgi:YidC/Oxa1 family membrane protein insertase
VVVGRAVTDSGGVIERTYTFHGTQYAVGTAITLDGMEDEIPATNRFIQLEWANGIRYQELNSVAESDNAAAIASYGGEIHELDADEMNQPVSEKANGNIQFVGTRIKYFAVAMIPEAGFDGMAQYNGVRTPLPDEGIKETYSLLYRLPYRGGRQTHEMTLFAGPMQYDTLGHYGLTEMMNFGFKWIVKPIGEFFMLPTMKFIQKFIPNWGVSIILFALLLKALLYPLSVPQMKSAQKMRLVAPLLNDVREKYKDDMKRQQQETMRLYSEYGINPAGGCLPLLLQMPFLYALYSVLNMNIELRQSAGTLHIAVIDDGVGIRPEFDPEQTSSLGLSIGDTFRFDVISTGGGFDPGVDHLSRNDFATDNWGTQSVGGSFLSYTVIPSPGALALLGMGGLMAGRRRR